MTVILCIVSLIFGLVMGVVLTCVCAAGRRSNE